LTVAASVAASAPVVSSGASGVACGFTIVSTESATSSSPARGSTTTRSAPYTPSRPSPSADSSVEPVPNRTTSGSFSPWRSRSDSIRVVSFVAASMS